MSEKWVAIKRLQAPEGGGPTIHIEQCPTLEAGTGNKVPAIARIKMPDEPEALPLFPLSAEGSPAKITQLQESAAAWLATVARSGGKCTGSLLTSAPPGLSEKMFLASSVPTVDETSSPSLPPLFNSGMASPGLFLTLNTGTSRNGASACSLSAILEASPDPEYLLSPKACSGILRRAERRGKELPEALRQALVRRAEEQQGPEKAEDKTPLCSQPVGLATGGKDPGP